MCAADRHRHTDTLEEAALLLHLMLGVALRRAGATLVTTGEGTADKAPACLRTVDQLSAKAAQDKGML